MSTIRKVAKHAGVSIATVSRVMNGSASVAPELRDRVVEAVNHCGYAPAVGRRSQTSIAIVYAGPFTIGSPFDAACLDGIVAAMLDSDYDLTIVHLRRDKKPDETYSQFFLRKGVRGAVVRSTSGDRDVARAIADEGFPVVVLGDHFDHPQLAFAFNESTSASMEGMEHLVSLGHRRIAFAANDTDDGDHLDRLEAYRESLQMHGLLDEQLIFRIAAERLSGTHLMRKVMSLKNPPTAIFIADPLIAEGAIKEAHRLGLRIPDDLSVLGFDDTDTRSAVYPTMTAICQDSRELGKAAFELLMRRCSGRATGGELVVLGRAWLEINHTAGRPPQKPIRILPSGERLQPVEP